MQHTVRRIDPLSAAKVAAVLYALMGLLFAPIMVLISMFAPGETGRIGVGLAIAIPVFYAVIGFVFTLIGAGLYNLIAGWVGGIKLELEV